MKRTNSTGAIIFLLLLPAAILFSAEPAKTSIGSNCRGMISLHDEHWSAFSDKDIKRGEGVVVTQVTGLKLRVIKKEG